MLAAVKSGERAAQNNPLQFRSSSAPVPLQFRSSSAQVEPIPERPRDFPKRKLIDVRARHRDRVT
jgi:hypothetical protein